MSEPIEAQIVPETQALAVRQAHDVAPGLFGTQDPAAVIRNAETVAQALKDVIVKRGLVSRISGKEYPRCEAWTLLGTMLGVFPVCVWSRKLDNGWEARVEARTKDGSIIGAAEAECLKTERNWANRDEFALRSMAQTRATAKCLRMPLGFVMSLTGFEVTPAEEMVSDHPQKPPERAKASGGSPDTTPTAKTPPGPVQTPKSAEPVPFPTDASRKKMIDALKANPGEPNRELVTEFFRKVPGYGPDSPQLAPFEELEQLRLVWVPATVGQMRMLSEKLTEFGNGERVSAPFAPHEAPDAPKQAGKVAEKVLSDSWRNVIVPIPRKGQKRDEYLKRPDTLGSLYDLRHGNDEESQAARQRLWGICEHHAEAKPWVGKDGKERPPSDSDKKFAEAVRAFKAWWAANHPDEKL